MGDALIQQRIRYRKTLESAFSRAYFTCRRLWEQDVIESMSVYGWPFVSRLIEQTEADPEHGWVLTQTGQTLVRSVFLYPSAPDTVQFGRIGFRRSADGERVELVWDRSIPKRVAKTYRRLIEFDVKDDYRTTTGE